MLKVTANTYPVLLNLNLLFLDILLTKDWILLLLLDSPKKLSTRIVNFSSVYDENSLMVA